MFRTSLLLNTTALLAMLYGFMSGAIPLTATDVMTAMLGFLGLNLLLSGLSSYRRTSKWLCKSVRTTGKVIDLAGRELQQDDPVFYPVVRYQTQWGQVVTFTSSVGSSPPSHAIGQRIEVVYLPDNPQKAEVDEFMSLWLVPIVLTIVGFSLLTAALGMIFSNAIF